jgi:hypothetical protein
MMPRTFRLAIALVRRWTRVYTAHMSPDLREARRAEIDSDLWEFQQDRVARRRLHPTVHVLVRLVLGIPDDLRWRGAHLSVGVGAVRTMLVLTTVVLLLAAVWLFDVMRTADLPLPSAPRSRFTTTLAPPPPPAPPPPRPR